MSITKKKEEAQISTLAFLLGMLMKINYAFVNHGPIPSWFLSKMSKIVVFENGPLTVQTH